MPPHFRNQNLRQTLNYLHLILRVSFPPKSFWLLASYLGFSVFLNLSGLMVEVSPGINLWYPLTALNLILLWAFGLRYTPVIFVAILLSIFLVLPFLIPPFPLLLLATVSTLGFSLATFILHNKLDINPQLQRVPDLVGFVSIALLTPLLIAIVNGAILAVSGLIPWSDYPTLALNFWMGDMISLLTLVPFAFLYIVPLVHRLIDPEKKLTLRFPTRQTLVDILGQILAILAILLIIFRLNGAVVFSLLYLCFIPLIWITLRYGLLGATANILAINLSMLLWASLTDFDGNSSLNLQIFMLILSLTGLFLGAIVTQYRQTLASLWIRDWAIVATYSDISERIEIEAALRASEERLRRVVSSISDHIYVTEINEQGQYVNPYFSPHIEALTGYPREKFEADWKFWPSFVIYPEDQEIAAVQAERLEMEQDSEVEYRLVRANGEIIWVRDSGRSERIGDKTYIYGVVSDITERKALEAKSKQAEDALQQSLQKLKLAYEHATEYAQELHEEITEREYVEEALRQSEERIRSVVDNVVDGIITIDEDNMIETFNAAAERIFGYLADQIIGKNFCVLIADEDQSNLTHSSLVEWLDAQANNPGSYEILGQRQDRTVFPMDLAVSEFSLGERRMFIGIVRDITERKYLERQLRQAQKMEAIGQLAGGVAHDFNNILMVISGHTELLLRRHSDPQDPQREDIELIKKASDRAANLTRQLLAFSRQQTLRPQILNLNTIVANFQEMLPRLIGEDIVIELELDQDLGCIKADPGQIEQVLMNLAVNARDAMPTGGTLTISTENVYLHETQTIEEDVKIAPGAYVMLSIADTGVGIDLETQSRIFDPFFTTKEHGKGTGLGLSTVYGIVRQSEGYIWVDSELGRGTAFKIYLPKVTEATESKQPSPSGSSTATNGATNGTGTILLVEDEASVRLITRRFLQKHNYVVLEANHPEKALELCQQYQGQIDLLITDLVMPYMNGHELAEQLAELYPNLKVLYISGYTDDTLNEQGVLEPDIIFLEKPFSSEALADKVREALKPNPSPSLS